MRFLFTFTILVLLIPGIVLTQDFPKEVWEYPITRYGVNEGLSQTQAVSALLDSENHLWIGTKNGLNRFNGIDFDNYVNSALFPSEQIWSLAEDLQGGIWAATPYGLFLQKDGELIDFSDHLKEFELNPRSLTFDGSGNLFFSNRRGGNKTHRHEIWKYSGGKFSPLTDTSNLNLSYNTVIFDDKTKTLVVWCYDRIKKEVLVVQISNTQQKIIKRNIADRGLNIFPTSHKGVIIQSADSIFLFDNGNLKFLNTYPPGVKGIRYVDKIGEKLYFASRQSLHINNGHKWETIYDRFNLIWSFIVEPSGNIWVTTEDGVFKVNYGAFRIYPRNLGLNSGVWSVIEDDDRRMFFASYGYGLQYLDSTGYHPVNVVDDDGREVLEFYMGAHKLRNGLILFPYSLGTLIYDGRFFKNLPGSGKRATFRYYEEDDGTLLIASDSLIQLSPPFTNSSRKIIDIPGKKEQEFILDIAKDRNDTFWASTGAKLVRIVGDSLKVFDSHSGGRKGAVCIHKDYNEDLWFGTMKGLSRLDYATGEPKPFFPELFKRPISFIESFGNEYLLVGAIDGLYILRIGNNLPESQIDWEYVSDARGFQGQEAGQVGVYKADNGHIWMLTTDKAIEFIPGKYSLKIPKLEVIIPKFSLRPNPTSVIDSIVFLNDTSKIQLYTDSRNIRISYYAIDYAYPKEITYKAMMEGFENNWSTPNNQRYSEFTTLPAGKYTFRVQALVNGRVVGEGSIPVIVKASDFWASRFWNTSRKYIVIVLLTASFLVIFIQYRKRKNSQQKELKTRFENLELEHQLIVSHINPHFLFNTLGAITNLIREENSELAKSSLKKLSNLLRQFLSPEKNVLIPLEKEIKITRDYIELEEIRKPSKFKYFITWEDGLNMQIKVPRLIIQSFVNNIFKHAFRSLSNEGLITISLSLKNHFLKILIVDNGIGYERMIDQDHEIESGHGIAIVGKCLKWLDNSHGVSGSTIKIRQLNFSDENPGTEVEVTCYAEYK